MVLRAGDWSPFPRQENGGNPSPAAILSVTMGPSRVHHPDAQFRDNMKQQGAPADLLSNALQRLYKYFFKTACHNRELSDQDSWEEPCRSSRRVRSTA